MGILKWNMQITNFIFSGRLECTVNLKQAREALAGHYQTFLNGSRKFPSLRVIVKGCSGIKAAVMLFQNGKIVCTGSYNEAFGRAAVEEVVKKLKEQGVIEECSYHLQIQNIVVLIQPRNFAVVVPDNAKIENVVCDKHTFPAAVYLLRDPKVSFLIFPNSKLICAGAPDLRIVDRAVNVFLKEMERHKCLVLMEGER
ncbi:MAG: hypothetical protein NWF09_08895 [Candidatus Bathyarchaeota archaeon]|nr:hypothetical protein [Candidatus Bathyarchaeota archaeon]